jgi:hypothetical protein
MFCVGTAVTRGGARCGWRIEGKRYEEVLALLSEMEKLAPKEVLESREGLLSKLVGLCLCVENYQYQWGMVLERWEERLRMLKEEWE